MNTISYFFKHHSYLHKKQSFYKKREQPLMSTLKHDLSAGCKNDHEKEVQGKQLLTSFLVCVFKGGNS